MKLYLSLATLIVGTTSVLNAQTERELDSHVHGLANLNVAIFDSSLLVELESPWDNMVGFEHAPSTDEQRAMVADALKNLNTPDNLLVVQGGNCLLQEAVVDSTLSMTSDEDAAGHDHDDEHHDEHDHDKHDDDKHAEHDHDKHDDDEHAEHHDEHDHEADTHSAVLATYRYECEEIAKLAAIDVTLFSVWSGFEELDVQVVGSQGQTQVELNPDNTMIDLSGIK